MKQSIILLTAVLLGPATTFAADDIAHILDMLNVLKQQRESQAASFNSEPTQQSVVATEKESVSIKGKLFNSRKEAVSCENRDNRTEILGRVRDQGELGWCYAYASADLLSYKLGIPVSAVDIAIFNGRTPGGQKEAREELGKNNSDPMGYTTVGGDVNEAIQAIGIVGACPEEFIRSDDFYYTALHNPDLVLTPEWKLWKRWSSNYGLSTMVSIMEHLNDPKYPVCGAMIGTQEMFTNANPLEIFELARDEKMPSFAAWLAILSCDGHRQKLAGIKVKEIETPDKAGYAFLHKIDEQLNRGNIVSIGYDPQFLYGNSYIQTLKEAAIEAGKSGKRWRDPNSSHASTVVARRFNQNTHQCEYLVRNSWGPSCDKYNTDKYECKITSKDPKPANGIYDDGNIWVNEKDLGKAMTDMQYLE